MQSFGPSDFIYYFQSLLALLALLALPCLPCLPCLALVALPSCLLNIHFAVHQRQNFGIRRGRSVFRRCTQRIMTTPARVYWYVFYFWVLVTKQGLLYGYACASDDICLPQLHVLVINDEIRCST